MPRLDLSGFGPPQVCLDQTSLTTLTAKTLALLFFLALENDRPHQRDALAGLFWPEQPDSAARNNLRQALFQLQRALGDAYFLITPQTIQFNSAGDYALDVTQFSSLLAEGATHTHRSAQTCRTCHQRLQRAVELYRGDFLAGLFLKNSDVFEEWVTVKREHFTRQVLEALERLTDFSARRGEFALMAKWARRQIELDSFRETAHAQLMRALTWQGERSAALKQYQTYRRILQDEFGISPSAETLELFEQIKRDQLARPQPLHSTLPVPLTSFVGRRQPLLHIEKHLETTRLLTLTGVGGCGKTRLAIEVARRLAEEYPDGVRFVPLADLTTSEEVPLAVAAVLGLREQPGFTMLDLILEYARTKHFLLVLDNCEHIVQTCAQFARRLIQVSPQIQILATSRERLGIDGEQVYPVLPMARPDLGTPADAKFFAENEAVQLFVARAQAHLPQFELTDQNARQVARICSWLEGLPLAIELAAARIPVLSVQQIAQKLDASLHRAEASAQALELSQQMMRATLDWSHQLLSEAERRLFRRLSIFAGGWTLSAMEDVCPDPSWSKETILDLLTRLVDKSVVVFDHASARYHMLAIICQYARNKLVEAESLDALQNRHLDYFMRLAEEAEFHIIGAEQKEWTNRLDVEHENLHQALRWASHDGSENPEAGMRLAAALWRYWHVRGHLTEGRTYLASVLNRNRTHPQELSLARTKALIAAGALAYYQGDYASANTSLHEGLGFARKLGARKEMAVALGSLGNIALSQGRYVEARSTYQEALTLNRESGDRWGIARISSNLGLISRSLGELEQATVLQEQALDLFRELKEKNGMAYALNALGDVARDRGDLAKARVHIDESEKIYRELGNTWGLAYVLDSRADVAFSSGDHSTAARLYRQSLELMRDEREMWGIAYAMESIAALELIYGRTLRSGCLFGAASVLRETIGLPLPPIDCAEYERHLGALRVRMGEGDFTASWEEGRKMTIEQAIALALNEPVADQTEKSA